MAHSKFKNSKSELSTIGNSAFENSINLYDVDFTNATKLASIGSNAFRGCNIGSELILPNSLTTIGASAFEANKITSFVIDNSTFTTENGIIYSANKTTLVVAPNILDGDVTVNVATPPFSSIVPVVSLTTTSK